MCIWKVSEMDRHCDFCTYNKCYERKSLFIRKEAEEKAEEEVLPEIPDAEKHEIWWTYLHIMNQILGGDIRSRCRRAELVWGRNFVAYQLHKEHGYSFVKIGYVINRDRTTVMYAISTVKQFLCYRRMYPKQLLIWEKFQKMIHLLKSSAYEKDSEMVVLPHQESGSPER